MNAPEPSVNDLPSTEATYVAESQRLKDLVRFVIGSLLIESVNQQLSSDNAIPDRPRGR